MAALTKISAPRKLRLTSLSIAIASIFSISANAVEVPVNNGVELQNAMKTASPGDEIVLYPGDYFGEKTLEASGNVVGHFFSDRDGTASNPIILRSANKNNKQVLKGGNFNNGYIFLLRADHWVVKDLKFRTAQKGIMVEGGNHNKFDNVSVTDTGAEAVHFRRNSSNNEITNCLITDTGKRSGKEGLGEGVYVGTHDGDTASNSWGQIDASNNNRIGGCHFGPDLGGEAFDIKAGTTGTVIESNYMDGRGIIGTAAFPNANSFIDLKGDRNIVRGNIMDYRGEANIEHAIQTSDVHQTSNVYDNTYTLSPSGYTYNIQDETLHLNNETRTDGGTQIVRKSYQDDHYDFNLDLSIEQPYKGPYPCFDELDTGCGGNTSGGGGDTGGGDTGGGDTGGGGNSAPTVNFTTPSGNLSVEEGYDIFFVATASDSDGTVSNLQLFIDNNLIRQESYQPYEWGHDGSPDPTEVNGLSVGDHDVRVVVTDNEGATSEDSFTLTVTAADTGGGDTGGGSCTNVDFRERAEINLSSASCVTFDVSLAGKRLAVWDSDTNSSCDFRGTVTSADGSGSLSVNSNYANSSSFSGTTVNFSASNGCQFLKVRAY